MRLDLNFWAINRGTKVTVAISIKTVTKRTVSKENLTDWQIITLCATSKVETA